MVVLEFSQEQLRRNALEPRFARDAKNRGINSGTLHCLELSPTKLGEHVLDECTDGHAITKQSQQILVSRSFAQRAFNFPIKFGAGRARIELHSNKVTSVTLLM